MKVLIFAPYACAFTHHETDVELAIRHLRKGDEVHIIQCRRELPTCDVNPDHNFQRCLTCHSTSSKSFLRIGIPKSNLHALDLDKFETKEIIPEFGSLNELRYFTWKDLPIGDAAAASVIALRRDTDPDLSRYQKFIRNTLKGWIQTYGAFQAKLKLIYPDRVYLFNGRSGPLHAALWAVRKVGIPVFVCDRDGFDNFIIVEGTTAGDHEKAKQEMEELRERMSSDPDAIAIASKWFEERRHPKQEIYGDFLGKQKRSHLPEGFDRKKTNIGLFIGSEDETFLNPKLQNPIYGSQLDAVKAILSAIPSDKFHFYLRIHPNLAGLDNAQNRRLKEVYASNLTVIEPGAPVDSYELMEACEKVVTFGSTVGIEAVYWGRPSILVGRGWGEDLGGMYRPSSHEETISMITGNLEPRPRNTVLLYGYWSVKKPLQFEHVVSSRGSHVAAGGVNGAPLVPSLITRFLLRWVNLWYRVKQSI